MAGLSACLCFPATAAIDEALIARLISSGKVEEARRVLEASDPTEADRRFFEARLTKGRGDLQSAIQQFRAVLSADPKYLNARRELAHTLLLAGQYDSAEFHFRELIRIDPVPELVEQYRRFLSVIDDNQPISVRVFGAILPSTNVNRGSSNAAFDTSIGQFVIDEQSRAESGIGAEAGVSGTTRLRVDPRSRFLLDWAVSTRIYENQDFTSATGVLAPAYEYAFAQGRWRAGPYLRYFWSGGDQSYLAAGASAALIHQVTETISVEVNGRAERRAFREQDFRDGMFSSSGVRLRKQIDPSFSVSAGVAIDRDAPQFGYQRYRGYRATAGIQKRWRGGFDTRASAEFGRRLYDDDFPFTTAPRRDKFWGGSFSILTSQFEVAGFTPQLSCSYIQSDSTIGLFEFDATECRVGFSSEF